MPTEHHVFHLFGSPRRWDESEWRASDDRVRGGSSQSYLTPKLNGMVGLFHGRLDTQTLGGAGFASQRTVDGAVCSPWDLNQFDTIRLRLYMGHKSSSCDKKTYSLVLKDQDSTTLPNDRENSTLSWEAEFNCPVDEEIETDEEGVNGRLKTIMLPFKDFKPTYRGRPKPDAEPLNLASVKRMSIMMRSFFDQQSGDFELAIDSIAAVKMDDKHYHDNDSIADAKERNHRNQEEAGEVGKEAPTSTTKSRSWLRWLCGN